MAASPSLLRDLREQVRALASDLRREPWTAEAGSQAELAAAALVVTTVLVRYCEDNKLIDAPFLDGPDDWSQLARDRQHAHFERHPEQTDADWIMAAADGLSGLASTLGLFDGLYRIMRRTPVSAYAATGLIRFWRRRDENGALVHDFRDPDLNPAFLGDMYQDLLESARREYALLQTPGFVATLIVDRTVGPALESFGARGLRVIDPACGSGTFLLLAFDRIYEATQRDQPGTDPWAAVRSSLAGVHGVDKHPIAAAISRFRLLLAGMAKAEARRLAEVPRLPIVIATGDSLLPPEAAREHAAGSLDWDLDGYPPSDANLLGRGSYHAVVTNPPYITVKDRWLAEAYRAMYPVCRGRYALTVPFTVRCFDLAVPGEEHAGFVGLLAANSFMKREFGRPLIEEFLPGVDLTHVIDTSGAYIPGHGTPTVILLGRARRLLSFSVRVALGVRGEPAPPDDPATGLVWTALTRQLDRLGSESEWIFVTDIDREQLNSHPWTLSWSGNSDLLAILGSGPRSVDTVAARIGYAATTGADDAFSAPEDVFRRQSAEAPLTARVITGSGLRDWTATPGSAAFFPGRNPGRLGDLGGYPRHRRRLWPYRATLRARSYFGGQSYDAAGREWYGWHQVAPVAGLHPWSIGFAWIATLGHFALLREDDVIPLQSAPVVRLPETATEADHLALLHILNSSTACYWLKEHSHSRGAPSPDQLRAAEPWELVYEFTSTVLGRLPLPPYYPAITGRGLDQLARQLAATEPSAICAEGAPTREQLDAARGEHERIRGRMIAWQEELDWDVYHEYGLLTAQEAADLVADPDTVPGLRLGERAFEIVMARQMTAGELETQWFARHRSTPVTEVPPHWPEDYRRVVEKRIEVIGRNRNIGLIERPECKRRWQSEPWEDKERRALTSWLLDRCEDKALWYGPDDQPRPMTVNRLADRLRADADAVRVAGLLAGLDADLSDILSRVLADEHVPYLAQFRYKATGLIKRAAWEQAWNLQRQEDKSGGRLDIPLPPKYASTDFHKQSFWHHRGKLDVPKERFISYPGASPGAAPSLLLGWAGWDHREQAAALITLIEDRSTTDGWGRDRLVPLIAGLAEVMPWVRQWHDQVDPAFSQSPADAYDAYLTSQREAYGLSEQDLRNWAAPPARRGRPPKPANKRIGDGR